MRQKKTLLFVINIHVQKVVDIVMKTMNAFVQKDMTLQMIYLVEIFIVIIKKKSKVTAFLLEFILGFGSGLFYIERTTLATIKMIYTTITCLMFCQYHSIRKITELKRFAIPLERILLIGWAVWQIIDGILIAFGFYKDGYGHELGCC